MVDEEEEKNLLVKKMVVLEDAGVLKALLKEVMMDFENAQKEDRRLSLDRGSLVAAQDKLSIEISENKADSMEALQEQLKEIEKHLADNVESIRANVKTDEAA